MNIILDKEINLNNDDLLHTKSYATTLKNLIMDAPDKVPLTIGLFGEWGSGKSSIVATLADQMQNDQSKRVKFVVYDAWKYANDSFRRMFLKKLLTDLKLKTPDKMKGMYENRNRESWTLPQFSPVYGLLIAFLLMILYAVYTFKVNGHDKQNGFIEIVTALSILNFVLLVISRIWRDRKVTVVEPYLFAPEQFEECFNEVVSMALKRPAAKSRFRNLFKKQPGPIDKLVIVIDNIDRCHHDTAYELLTNTKNFINLDQDVIFLIPVDDVALRKHIFKHDVSEQKENEEFLRKYFNITIRIKPYKITEIFEFARGINRKENLGFKPDTINIIAKEYASNPRRIKQFFNNLQIEMEVMTCKYGKAFSQANEMAICQFLVIREEWPAYYKKLCQDPDLFFKEEEPENTDVMERYEVESLESFLYATKIITRGLNYEILQKILINKDNDEKLPDSILGKITTQSFKDFDVFLERMGYTPVSIIESLISELKKAVTSKLYATDIPDILDHICIFLLQYPELNRVYYTEVETAVKNRVKQMITNARSFERLVAFNNRLLTMNADFLEKGISKYLLEITDEILDGAASELYGAYIREASTEQLLKVKPGFKKYLSSPGFTGKLERNLRPDQLDVLYDAEIIEMFYLNKDMLLWDDDENIKYWIYLAQNMSEQSVLLKVLLRHAKSIEATVYDPKKFIGFFARIFFYTRHVKGDAELTVALDEINELIFADHKRNHVKITAEGKRYFNAELPGGSTDQLFKYLLESYRISGASEASARWIFDMADSFDAQDIKVILAAFVKKYRDVVNFERLKPLIFRFEIIDKTTNELLLNLLYLKLGGEDLFTQQEINVLLTKIIKNVKDFRILSGFMEEHVKKRALDGQVRVMYGLIQSLWRGDATADDEDKISFKDSDLNDLGFIGRNGSARKVRTVLNDIKLNLLNPERVDEMLQLIIDLKNIFKRDAENLRNYIYDHNIQEKGSGVLYHKALTKLFEKIAEKV